MDFEIRQARKEDYNALCRLFKQGDRLHHQDLPETYFPIKLARLR